MTTAMSSTGGALRQRIPPHLLLLAAAAVGVAVALTLGVYGRVYPATGAAVTPRTC